jgi:hypothetical protein
MAQVNSENSIAVPIGDGALYLKTPVTPEQLFQAIGRLRNEARNEINRLIEFLDKTDSYVSRELEDDNDREEVGDTESSLGSFDRMTDQSKSWLQRGEHCGANDLEQDGADNEESEASGIGDQDGLDEQVPFRDWQNVGMV